MDMKKWKTLVPALVLLVVIVAAAFFYDRLRPQVQVDSLAAVPTEQTTVPSEQEQTTGPAEQTTEPAEQTTGPAEESGANPAPGFTVYDAEGNPVTWEDMRGKPVILNFWATWCGYCVAEMPEFQEVFEEYGDQIHFMMVNVTDGYQETQEDAAAFIAEKGFTFPVYYDLELSATNAYGVNAMPVTYLMDAEGNFVAWGQGALDKAALMKGVEMLIGSEE